MAVTTEQERQIRLLLADNKSERFIVDAVGVPRRQVRNIKQSMPKNEAPHPFAHGLQSTISQAAAVGALVELSTRPEGVRRSEMWPTLRARFGMRENDKTGELELNMTADQLRYLKDKTKEAAESRGTTALFIPEWLPRHAPEAANDTMVRFAGYLHDRVQEYANEFTSLFPDTSVKLVTAELLYLAFPPRKAEPVEVRCRRNHETAEALQRRLGPHARRTAANDPVLVDAELDNLCI